MTSLFKSLGAFRKAALAATVVLSVTASSQAAPILFDPDGATPLHGGTTPANLPAVVTNGLDWKVGNALSIGAQTVIQNTIAMGGLNSPDPTKVDHTPFTTLYQATLLGYSSVPGNGSTQIPGLGVNFEITIVASFKESLVSLTSTANSATALFNTVVDPILGSGKSGILQIFYKELTGPNAQPKSNDDLGTNFQTGQLILQATINADPSPSTSFTTQTTVPPVVMDPTGNNQTQLTVTGFGTTFISASVIEALTDHNFFKDLPPAAVISTAFNTSQVVPYSQTQASDVFWNAMTGSFVNPNLGAVNGLIGASGPDFQFQADANQSFTLAPEPGTIASSLVGLALAGLAARRRRVTA